LSASISGLIPELRPFARRLLVVAGQAGLQPRITSTYRSPTEQARLYRRFLSGNNPYPVAPPGHSAHEAGFAFDMMIQDSPGQMESDLADLGQVWESWGGIWGGHFKDPIHFEYPGFTAAAPTSEEIPCGGLLGLAHYKCTKLYHAEDIALSFLTPMRWTIAKLLMQYGYPESEAARIAAAPVSELHRKFPWLPV